MNAAFMCNLSEIPIADVFCQTENKAFLVMLVFKLHVFKANYAEHAPQFGSLKGETRFYYYKTMYSLYWALNKKSEQDFEMAIIGIITLLHHQVLLLFED